MPRKEQCGPYPLEIHWLHTDNGALLAVSRIRPPQGAGGHREAVILLHGSYSKRNFWLSDKGVGLGAWLFDAGYDVWIPELRGHGLSPKGERFCEVTAEDQIKFDVPAIHRYVTGETGAEAFWVGHSFGGLFILAALSSRALAPESIRGVVTFGSQISKGERYLKFPPLAWVLKRILKTVGYFPAPRFGLGPEIESAGTMIETIRWKQLGGRWTDAKGFSYWDGLADIRVPVLSMAAAADKNDPPEGCRMIYDRLGSPDKTFVLLGRQTGFSRDYDHIGMVVSKSAQYEVWPEVGGWMAEHRPADVARA